MKLLQVVLIGVGVLAPVTMTIRGSNPAAQVGEAVSTSDAPSSTWTARLTLFHGGSRLVKIEGVGCTRSICSRTDIRGRGEHEAFEHPGSLDSIPFDAIDAIQNTTPTRALFVLKDGTRRRISLVTDFRVLYVRDESGKAQKLDLSEVASVEFVAKQ